MDVPLEEGSLDCIVGFDPGDGNVVQDGIVQLQTESEASLGCHDLALEFAAEARKNPVIRVWRGSDGNGGGRMVVSPLVVGTYTEGTAWCVRGVFGWRSEIAFILFK